MCKIKVPLALVLSVWSAVSGANNILPLAGEWRFAIDVKNEGTAKEWFKTALSNTMRLPGLTDENRNGPVNTHAPEMNDNGNLALSLPTRYEGPGKRGQAVLSCFETQIIVLPIKRGMILSDLG